MSTKYYEQLVEARDRHEVNAISFYVFNIFIKEVEENKQAELDLLEIYETAMEDIDNADAPENNKSATAKQEIVDKIEEQIKTVSSEIDEEFESLASDWSHGSLSGGIPQIINNGDCIEIFDRYQTSVLELLITAQNEGLITTVPMGNAERVQTVFDIVTCELTAIISM